MFNGTKHVCVVCAACTHTLTHTLSHSHRPSSAHILACHGTSYNARSAPMHWHFAICKPFWVWCCCFGTHIEKRCVWLSRIICVDRNRFCILAFVRAVTVTHNWLALLFLLSHQAYHRINIIPNQNERFLSFAFVALHNHYNISDLIE